MAKSDYRMKGSDVLMVRVDDRLDELLALDTTESRFNKELAQEDSRAKKCNHLATNFFNSRNMRSVASGDQRALALLLYKLTQGGPS